MKYQVVNPPPARWSRSTRRPPTPRSPRSSTAPDAAIRRGGGRPWPSAPTSSAGSPSCTRSGPPSWPRSSPARWARPPPRPHGEVEFTRRHLPLLRRPRARPARRRAAAVQPPGTALIRKAPVGPLLGIMPWNYPYYQVARFAGPNLVVGNTILLKHAPQCPESALAMEQHLPGRRAVPADAYINVFASNEQVADIIADPRVRGVSVTGSRAGRLRRGRAAGAAPEEGRPRAGRLGPVHRAGTRPTCPPWSRPRSSPAWRTPARPATRPSGSS